MRRRERKKGERKREREREIHLVDPHPRPEEAGQDPGPGPVEGGHDHAGDGAAAFFFVVVFSASAAVSVATAARLLLRRRRRRQADGVPESLKVRPESPDQLLRVRLRWRHRRHQLDDEVAEFRVVSQVDPPAEAAGELLVFPFVIVQGGKTAIGIGKIESLVEEAGTEAVAVMRSIKLALDPHGILNPGKIFTARL